MAITFGVNLSVDNYWDVPEFAWRAEDLGSLISISSSSSKVKNLCAISFLLFFVYWIGQILRYSQLCKRGSG